MAIEAISTAKPKRKQRRNFAEERARVIQFCRMAIQIYTPLSSADDKDAQSRVERVALYGRIEGYRDVLKQMGEAE